MICCWRPCKAIACCSMLCTFFVRSCPGMVRAVQHHDQGTHTHDCEHITARTVRGRESRDIVSSCWPTYKSFCADEWFLRWPPHQTPLFASSARHPWFASCSVPGWCRVVRDGNLRATETCQHHATYTSRLGQFLSCFRAHGGRSTRVGNLLHRVLHARPRPSTDEAVTTGAHSVALTQVCVVP